MQLQAGSGSSGNGRSAPAQGDSAHADLPFRGLTEWPTLSDGDGGRNVHHLQVALRRKGFDCHNDDLLWWQYSDSTQSAVQYFQVSYGMWSSSNVAPVTLGPLTLQYQWLASAACLKLPCH